MSGPRNPVLCAGLPNSGITLITELLQVLGLQTDVLHRPACTIERIHSTPRFPAWGKASTPLAVGAKLLICVRQPQQVCWSQLRRGEPGAARGWRRIQRRWLEEYRALLERSRGLPCQVVVYEAWLQPDLAEAQLLNLADFLNLASTADQLQRALKLLEPEGAPADGIPPPPTVHPGLSRLYAALADSKASPRRRRAVARRASLALGVQEQLSRASLRLRLLWLRTPWGEAQLGLGRLGPYRRHFARQADLRLHPLISPAHLNRERQHRGLEPLKSADALLGHLLGPDLVPLDPHPWFAARSYQQRLHGLGVAGKHPVLTYLQRARLGQANPYPQPGWLEQLGAAKPTEELLPLPPLLQRLHPGLVLADPRTSFGDPATGEHPVIEAHEAYWQDIADTFALWPDNDAMGPLRWLSLQSGLERLGTSQSPPALGLASWWLPGDWHAALLAELAGADRHQSRQFSSLEALVEALADRRPNDAPVLVGLTPALLAHLTEWQRPLPPGVAVLNLAWPAPGDQSAWLQLLAGATGVIECRPTIRAYLQAIGLPALWCAPASAPPAGPEPDRRHLLLALSGGLAERQLAARAEQLDPGRYSAYLRLDAQMQYLPADGNPAAHWLERMRRTHSRWLWLEGVPPPQDIQAQAVLAWVRQHGVALTLVKTAANDDHWLTPLLR